MLTSHLMLFIVQKVKQANRFLSCKTPNSNYNRRVIQIHMRPKKAFSSLAQNIKCTYISDFLKTNFRLESDFSLGLIFFLLWSFSPFVFFSLPKSNLVAVKNLLFLGTVHIHMLYYNVTMWANDCVHTAKQIVKSMVLP